MRHVALCIIATLCATAPAAAVDFLGIELCEGSVDTSVVLPVGSPLSLESAEIGRYGGLLLLLTAENGDIMDHIDNLMAFYTGTRGTGDAKKLQWTGNQLTAYAQQIKKGYAALAVSTTDACRASDINATAVTDEEAVPEDTTSAMDKEASESHGTPAAEADAAAAAKQGLTSAPDAAAEAAVAAVVAAAPEIAAPQVTAPVATEQPESPPDFELKGRLKHAAAEDGWVDVMGVVVNNSGSAYTVASFDLSLYDASGDLVCVDTISVNQLRDGQERAFRGSIRCADYDPAAVDSWKLQFAGAH